MIDRSPCRVYANDRATWKLGFTQSKNGWCRAGVGKGGEGSFAGLFIFPWTQGRNMGASLQAVEAGGEDAGRYI